MGKSDPKQSRKRTMKSRCSKALVTQTAAKKQAGAGDGVKVLKLSRLPRAQERRIERILKWEDESARTELVIAGRRTARVDAT